MIHKSSPTPSSPETRAASESPSAPTSAPAPRGSTLTPSWAILACGPAYSMKGLLVNGNQALNMSPMCATDATSSTGAPLFDPTRPYHLTATSPCRDKAGTANLPPDDIDGDTRFQGAAADCGADEYAP
jgi:hypothetical protein